MRRIILPLVFGLVGAGILVALGVWQMQRLAWKEGVIAQIEARIGDAPVSLPRDPDPERDRYMPVDLSGQFQPGLLRVLVSRKQYGAGYRLISPFEVEGRRIMVDRGFLTAAAEVPQAPTGPVRLVGNLHWPSEVDSFTPEPDEAGNIWFARDVPRMAQALGTEPVLVILAQASFDQPQLTPLPVDTSGIPNDHLNYAITWFSLALVWLGMTAALVWRITRRTI